MASPPAAFAALARLGPEVADAWRESCLGDLPRSSAEQLLRGARRVRLAAGETLARGAGTEDAVTVALVVEGLVRLYARADDGRQVMLRYAAAGAVVGLAPVLAAGPGATLGGSDALASEALRDTMILKFDASRVHAAVTHDAEVARAVAFDLAQRLTEARQRLLCELFLPVRSRVAAQLLDLAERDGPRLVVRTSHQGIAASIGSVREVVARTLKAMEREGLIDRVGGPHGGLRLLDPAALHALSTTTAPQRVRDDGASRPSARARSTASARVWAPSFA